MARRLRGAHCGGDTAVAGRLAIGKGTGRSAEAHRSSLGDRLTRRESDGTKFIVRVSEPMRSVDAES